ncbi:hypothetical protein Bca101_097443 [Brassica carinata]
MDSNPFLNLNFVDLFQSQQDSGIGLESSPIPLFGTQATEDSNFEQDSAAKRSGKKPIEEGKGREEFERVWSYKQEDLSRREKLSKIGLLDRQLARKEPLPDYEETLKKKLINELFSS